MRQADHGGFADARAADRLAFEVDRADPLAARLDHVLRPVGYLHVAVRIAPRDVAGIEPAVGIADVAAVAGAIFADDPRTAPHQVTEPLHVTPQLARSEERAVGKELDTTTYNR